jgi:hypothetical protein
VNRTYYIVDAAVILVADSGDCCVRHQVRWSCLNANFWNQDCLIIPGYPVKLLENLPDLGHLASAVVISRVISRRIVQVGDFTHQGNGCHSLHKLPTTGVE